MDDAWNTLCLAGLPLGPVRAVPARAVAPERLRAALATLSPTLRGADERARESLLAWLRGFRHHFGGAFARTFGPAGDAAIETLEATPIDPNRYLKLRRIAVENLCAWQ